MSISENAKRYFSEGKYNCCQAVVCAYCDEYGINDDEIFKLTEGFGAGMGALQDTCGAVTGMFMALGLHDSAGDKYDPRKTKMKTYEMIRKSADVFKETNGSIYCRDLKAQKDGKQIVSCERCVETAAVILETYIKNHK